MKKMNGLCLFPSLPYALIKQCSVFKTPPRLLTEKEREMEKDTAKGEWVEKEGVVPDRSCESNYVLGNVIICDE